MENLKYYGQRIAYSFLSDILIGKGLIFTGGGFVGYSMKDDDPQALYIGIGLTVVGTLIEKVRENYKLRNTSLLEKEANKEF